MKVNIDVRFQTDYTLDYALILFFLDTWKFRCVSERSVFLTWEAAFSRVTAISCCPPPMATSSYLHENKRES